MHTITFFSLLLALALALTISASPALTILNVPTVKEPANIIARAPLPIPSLATLSPPLSPLPKRDEDKLYTFGAYKTMKSPGSPLSASFNETSGSTWCNEIPDVGKDEERNNFVTGATIDSHVGWEGPENRPPEYVCFFYESRGKCDPEKGHAEYVESVPGPKGSANETEFDAGMFKYVSWGCQWHPLNKKSTKGGTGWP